MAMKRTPVLMTAAALVAAASMGFAGGVKPNTLTPQEASEGWILLFDGDTSYGWTPRGDAKWEVKDGTVTAAEGSGKGLLTTTTEFANYRLQADFWVDERCNSGVFLRVPAAAAGADAAGGYEVNIY